MALCPSTVASSGKPQDLYFIQEENIPAAQVLSQAGNTISLSGGGGSANIASTTSVASSAQKLTAVTYNTGLLETNVAGVLNVGLGSAIGSTRVEGAKIVIQRDPGEPQIEFVKGVNVERIKYDGTKLLMGSVDISGQIGAQNMVLTSDAAKVEFKNGLGVLKGSMGYNVGTDFMDLTGAAGFEINTTNGPLNITANGDKINMITNGNNIELFGNTTAGIFADVNIGSSDGVISLGTGGHVEFLSPTEVITKSLSVIETATPTLRFQTTGVGPTQADVVYNPTGSIFGNTALITNVNEFQVATGATTRVAMGYDASVSASYVSAGGGNLFLGESGANSYSGIVLGDLATGGLFLDRKDDTNVTQSAATMVLTGTGQINIETSLATGGIGISTLAAANIGISSGQGVAVSAATDIILQAPSGDITMNVGNAAGRINLTGGTALITTVPPIGITGNYLLLTINSVTYKIALVT